MKNQKNCKKNPPRRYPHYLLKSKSAPCTLWEPDPSSVWWCGAQSRKRGRESVAGGQSVAPKKKDPFRIPSYETIPRFSRSASETTICNGGHQCRGQDFRGVHHVAFGALCVRAPGLHHMCTRLCRKHTTLPADPSSLHVICKPHTQTMCT